MSDQDPFTLMIQEHHASLRHYIAALGVNHAWVDDLAQETFLIVYRKWDEFTKVDNQGAWLRTVAKNLVLNETAKIGRRQRLFNEKLTSLLIEAEDRQPAPEYSPETLKALKTCISLLTDRSRTVVEARYFRNRTSQDIGEDLDMKPAAVRKVLFHARHALADCLRAKQPEAS